MRQGITRLEVLIITVVAVTAAGLGLMALSHHRENALRIQCVNNLRRIGFAFNAYEAASAENEEERALPPSRLAEKYATWAVFLAPYLVEKHPLQAWDLQRSYFDQEAEVRESWLIMYFCPARSRTHVVSQAGDDIAGHHVPGGLGDYACVAGDGSPEHDWTSADADGALVIADVVKKEGDRILAWKSRTSTALFSSLRGASYTLLVGEKHVLIDHLGEAAFGDGSLYNGQHPASFSRVAGPGFPLAQSVDEPLNLQFGSYHKGLCNFLQVDASVRVITTDVPEDVLGRLARRGND